MRVREPLESLMVAVMNRLAERFGNHAILKGGMALRLLDCPRATNDLDYVFVPFSSKNDVKNDLVAALRSLPDAEVACSLNSKALRCIVRQGALTLQVEAQAQLMCDSQALSTATLARAHQQQGRIIRVMRLDVALAHKLAAWNERRLIRDLFDIHFLHQVVGVKPHVATLARRLQKVESRIPGTAKKRRMSLAELANELDHAAAGLTARGVREQLRDYLGREDLTGLELRLRVALAQLAAWLRSPAAS